MRKYILNGAVLGSVFGAVSVVQSTRHGPRDWKLALMWVSWGINVAIAIGTVLDDNREPKSLDS